MNNVSDQSDVSPLSTGMVFQIAGCCVAIFFPLVAFLALAVNRSLRVKRQYIISINLCLSIVILYVGFLISLFATAQDNSSNASSSCIAGALFVMFGWLCLHFWLLANWVFLAFAIQQRVPRHISHFFIKSTLPTYGTAVLFLVVISGMSVGKSPKISLSENVCWFDLQGEKGIEWVFFLATAFAAVGVVGCAVYCSVKFTCKKNKNATSARLKKNRQMLMRLTLITLVIAITSILHLTWWLKGNELVAKDLATTSASYSRDEDFKSFTEKFAWLKIMHGLFIGVEGISVVLYMVFPINNFQSVLAYCTAVIKCQDPSTVQPQSVGSTRRSKHVVENKKSDVRASMSSEERSMAKYEPREEFATDDVFMMANRSSNPITPVSTVDKKITRARAATLKTEREMPSYKSHDSPLSHGKKRGFRNSFRKINKTLSAQSHPPETPTSPPPTLPPKRFYFNRHSKISMGREHERKTSF